MVQHGVFDLFVSIGLCAFVYLALKNEEKIKIVTRYLLRVTTDAKWRIASLHCTNAMSFSCISHLMRSLTVQAQTSIASPSLLGIGEVTKNIVTSSKTIVFFIQLLC